MKAAVFSEPGVPLRIEDLRLEGPRSGEILIDLVAAGVCHSDWHVVKGDWQHKVPIVLGHEGAGVVIELGEGVTNVEVGDHVIVSWMPSCGACLQCVVGRPWLCEKASAAMSTDAMFDGTTRLTRPNGETVYQYLSSGVFAEQVVTPAGGAVKIRRDAPLTDVAIVGCAIATGYGAVRNTAGTEWGSSMAVIGCGAVGMSAILAGRQAGVRRIIAVDVEATKLDVALRLGATDTVNASCDDPVEAVKQVCSGGVDYAFECIGLPSTCVQAIEMLAVRGTAVIVGLPKANTRPTFDAGQLSASERRIVGCNYGSVRPSVDFPKLVDLYMGGQLPVNELITKRRPLSEIQEAFDDLAAGRGLRTVLDCARP